MRSSRTTILSALLAAIDACPVMISHCLPVEFSSLIKLLP